MVGATSPGENYIILTLAFLRSMRGAEAQTFAEGRLAGDLNVSTHTFFSKKYFDLRSKYVFSGDVTFRKMASFRPFSRMLIAIVDYSIGCHLETNSFHRHVRVIK